MNVFERKMAIGRQGIERLKPFLRETTEGFVILEKGPLALVLQKDAGDVLAQLTKERGYCTVEIKTEQEQRGPNLFLEVFSNMNLANRRRHEELGSTPGWMFSSRSQLLLYYFLSSDNLYVMNLFALKKWFWTIRGFKPEELKRCDAPDQLNDTWGVPLPIGVIAKHCHLFRYRVAQGRLFSPDNEFADLSRAPA